MGCNRIDLFYFRKKWSAVGHVLSSLWFPPVKNAQESGRKGTAGLFSDDLIGLWTAKCHDTQKMPGREKCCVHEGFCVIQEAATMLGVCHVSEKEGRGRLGRNNLPCVIFIAREGRIGIQVCTMLPHPLNISPFHVELFVNCRHHDMSSLNTY